MMNNYEIFILASKKFQEFENNLNTFAEKYMDSPWAGIVIFLIILAASWWFIKDQTKR